MKRRYNDDEDEPNGLFNNSIVKELQTIASVFTAMKEFSSNPLNTMIERKVGDMAAQVIEKTFNQSNQPKPKDFMTRILNSQFAMSYGMGLGQRAPEMVEAWKNGTRNQRCNQQ